MGMGASIINPNLCDYGLRVNWVVDVRVETPI